MVSKVEELLLDYPKSWVLEDGTKVTVRPLEKRDRETLALFFIRTWRGKREADWAWER